MAYDDAVEELFKAPHGDFVEERKRLSGELKAEGDKTGAARLGRLARPPISAWTVNQLWWQAREELEAMFESAEKIRHGDLGATAEHRDAIAKLRARAQTILTEAGNAAAESTLRRVTTTLSALAATGGFDPDPPGALSADRDPPGFEALGALAASLPAAKPKPAKAADAADADDDDDDDGEADAKEQRRLEAEAKRAANEAAADRRKQEAAEAKRLSKVRGLEVEVAGAKSEVERKQKDLDRLKKAVEAAEAAVEKSRAALDELEAKLAEAVEEAEG